MLVSAFLPYFIRLSALNNYVNNAAVLCAENRFYPHFEKGTFCPDFCEKIYTHVIQHFSTSYPQNF